MRLKAVCLLLCAGLLSAPAVAAPEDDDAWSGRYRLTWTEGPAFDVGEPDTVLVIARTPDADPAQYPGDLARWTAGPDEGINKEKAGELSRLSPDNYQEPGLAALYAAGGIECLDSGVSFICRVKPGTTVVFGGQKILARTGFFGGASQAGFFELTKLESTP